MDSLEHASPIHRKCLISLHSICGRRAILPKSLLISLGYNPMEIPLYHGGFADVWKGTYQGRDVAVKVLRIYSRNDFYLAKRVSCRKRP